MMLLGTVTSHQACYSKVPPLLSRLERQQSQSWHPGWWQHLCLGQTLIFFLIIPTGQAFYCACFHASPGENSICQGESQQVHGDRQAGESEDNSYNFWNVHFAGIHWHLQLVWRLLHHYWWRWLCVHRGVEEPVGFHLWKRLVKLLCFPITTSKENAITEYNINRPQVAVK